jgi:hypothetical protein
MKKFILRVVFVLGSTLILSAFEDLRVKDILPTIYTVSSIIFSIGMGLIVSFSLDGVKHDGYIREIRLSILNVRNSFIIYFALSTIFYITCPYVSDIFISYIDIKFSPILFTSLFLVLSISYYIVNFIEIQNLKDDIFDRINEEKNKNG